ncbi:MAG: NifB/NifX family molybdenum-iron cluster-binding protein [Saezia sp.]
MKIGLPIDTVNQLESEIAANLKTAPAFLVFDTQSKNMQIIDTQNGVCGALPAELDVIIFADGMGRGMFNNLQSKGVKVFQTHALTVKEALEAFEGGNLETVKDVACCSDHDGGGEHHHHHQHGGGGCCGGSGH